jgi:hypothetical protein
MKYIVAEVQTYDNGTVAVVNPVEVFDDANVARSRWHQIMAVAETSELPCHGAIMFDSKCSPHNFESCEHPVDQPTPQPEAT